MSSQHVPFQNSFIFLDKSSDPLRGTISEWGEGPATGAWETYQCFILLLIMVYKTESWTLHSMS